MTTLDHLQQVRINKLEEIRKLGIDPYPSLCHRDQTIKESRDRGGKSVSVAGRIISLRGHGKIIFTDIIDAGGKIQAAFKSDLLKPEAFVLVNLLDVGDFVAIQGKVGQTQAGEITIFTQDFQIIGKAIRPLPDKWYGFKDVEERYRKRYLDILMNPKVKDVFEKRSKVINSMRSFLVKKGYIEVETPILQPIYGGGLARPFKTYHNALGIPLYMRISTELYLKRLIVSGFEKVFEIAKVFRNEGIDKDHNPEFTILETMEAYKDYQYNMKLVEDMIGSAVVEATGSIVVKYQDNEIDFKTPWKRMTMVEAVKKTTGADFTKIMGIDEALKTADKLGVKLEEYHKSAVGLILAAIFEEKVKQTLVQPTIIYDYPVETSPLAKRCVHDPRFTQRWEHYIAGKESSNNYSELNDPIEIRERFSDERKKERLGDTEAHQTDEDFIGALEYGMPPTSGIGPGIDRLIMIITDSSNLRDVIIFPTLKPPSDGPDDILLKEKKGKEISSGKKDVSHRIPQKLFSRPNALDLLHQKMQNQNLRRHCYAVEAAMRNLAKKFGEDEAEWGIAGLLHDADYELTKADMSKHVITVIGWLKEMNIEEKIITAVYSHGWKHVEGCPKPQSKMDWSLYCCDDLTGLIVAVAMVRPDRKLSSVTVESVMKKWDNKSFAAGAKRDQIQLCEKELGIKLADFIGIVLSAMQSISRELGL